MASLTGVIHLSAFPQQCIDVPCVNRRKNPAARGPKSQRECIELLLPPAQLDPYLMRAEYTWTIRRKLLRSHPPAWKDQQVGYLQQHDCVTPQRIPLIIRPRPFLHYPTGRGIGADSVPNGIG